MICLFMGEKRLKKDDLAVFGHDYGTIIPNSIVEYPERDMLRGDIPEMVDKWIGSSNMGHDLAIITDSDFILDEFRANLKEKNILASELFLYVFTDDGWGTDWAIPNLDQNGRFDFLPNMLDFAARQLMRLI